MPSGNIKVCRWCDADIMLCGERWYYARIADINGFCPKNPEDDVHEPVADS
jgi:hypothetical protein